MEDFYELLGVSRSASDDQIKKAYRAKARELHPDTNDDPAAEEQFKKVTLAYEVLRDAERRRRYDMFGPEGLRGTGAGAGGSGAGGFPGDVFGGGGLGDLFEQFFGSSGGFFGGGGGGRQPAGPPRGPDMETFADLDFHAAVFGTQSEVRLRLPVACETCSGSGARPGTQPATCSQCGGAGEVRTVRQTILGQMVTASACRRCGGMGQEVSDPCPDCRGEGRRTDERTYTVDVPAGVDDGSTLRLPGRGGAGSRGGPAGDLYVHLRVRPDQRFRRQENDLVEVLHVPVTQAALGATLSYETLDGTEELVVPRGTQTGKVFRFRGKGVPQVGGRGGRGDIIVQVVVDTPADLTKEQEDILRLLATERGDEVAPPDSGLRGRIRSAFK